MRDETTLETQLLGRVAAGDQQAFAAFFDRCSPAVLGLLVRMLGRRGEAEEVLQEVFLDAWRRASEFDPRRGAPRGWLLAMARSRGLDCLRSRRSRERREEETVRQERLGNPSAEAVGTGRLEAAERSRAVSSALDALPEEQRAAIELAFFEGLTQSQIARRLALPLGTAKSRVLLGMKKLRQLLRSPDRPVPDPGEHEPSRKPSRRAAAGLRPGHPRG